MKLFRFMLIATMIFFSVAAHAQDVIVKKDGGTIVSKVLEIDDTIVRYKKFSNLEGPTYSIAKVEVNCINYENGEKETFSVTEAKESALNSSISILQERQRISDQDLVRMVASTKNYSLKAKRLKRTAIWGGVAIFTAGAIVAYDLGCWSDGYDTYFDAGEALICMTPFIGVSAIWTGSFLIASKQQYKKAKSLMASSDLPLTELKLIDTTNSSLCANIKTYQLGMSQRQGFGLGIKYNF